LRQQVTGITVALPNNTGTPLNLGYSYCPSGSASCTSNNGNVLGATIAANGAAVSNQSYVYDGLNRLALAVENPVGTPSTTNPVCTGVAGTSWCQQYGYDIYGNNTMASANLGGIVAPTGFDPATNRIVPNGGTSGWNYDLAGDINRDAAGVTYAFDADGRMAAACPNQSNPALCTNQWASGQIGYTYDGNGARVQMTRVDGTTTTFVYDAAGRLAADFGGAVASGTQYLFADTLGSTRMVITSTKTSAGTSTCVTSRLDYLPFGYEVPGSVGLRQNVTEACAGQSLSTYSDDPVFRQKFTGKERDAETGLDYFGARYMSSAQGRFASADPLPWVHWQNGSKEDRERFEQFIANPQNMNVYVYVRNDPLSSVDPDGEDVYVVAYTVGNNVHGGDDQFREAAETKADEIRNQKGFDPKKDTVIVQGVKTKQDFKDLLSKANGMSSQFGQVRGLTLFSHAGDMSGPFFHAPDGKSTEKFSQSELSQLHINWASGATATFFGCNTDITFTQEFANAQHVRAYGYDGGTRFSGTPGSVSKWYVLNPWNTHLYLVDAAEQGLQHKDPQ
jgi:RHS repeat-associated protein